MYIEITQVTKVYQKALKLEVEIPDELEPTMEKLKELELRIVAEPLMGNMVVQYIFHEKDAFAIMLSPLEQSHAQLIEMLTAFDEEAFKIWLGETTEEGKNNGET